MLVVEDFFAAEPDEVYHALLRSLPPAGCRVLSADAPLGVLIFLAQRGGPEAEGLMTATIRRWNTDGVVARVSAPGGDARSSGAASYRAAVRLLAGLRETLATV